MLSMMKQVLDGISMLENKSNYSDPSTLPPCKSLTRASLEAIASMTQVQDRLLRKRKRRDPLESHTGTGILLLLLL